MPYQDPHVKGFYEHTQITNSDFYIKIREIFTSAGLWPHDVKLEYKYADDEVVVTWKVENVWHTQRIPNSQQRQAMYDLLLVRVRMSAP